MGNVFFLAVKETAEGEEKELKDKHEKEWEGRLKCTLLL
jgi:hypothetical protein